MEPTHRNCISPIVFSGALLICSVAWCAGVFAWYLTGLHSKDGWSGTPLIWMLILCLSPAICCVSGYALVRIRKQSGGQFTGLDCCALLAGCITVLSAGFVLFSALIQMI